MTERESLRGNVLFHPSTKTPHDYPSFLRSAVCRVVAGSMLLSGTVSGLAALTTMHETKLACALSTAVSFVAFYHYGKLVQLRENKDATVALATPGKATDEALPLGLKLAWIDMQADAVRYSDWLVTLPLLVVEMHLLVPSPKLFGIPQATALTCLMILLGAYTRFGTDELVPIRKDQRRSLLDGFARISGAIAFLGASVCLFFVLWNLLGDLKEDEPTGGWIYAYTLPWAAYGVVSVVAMAVRQFYPEGYPESLSVFKDSSFGALDIWSKSSFGIWVAAKAMDLSDPIFKF